MVVEPGPKYREEVIAPGRQGIRAKRELQSRTRERPPPLGPRTTAIVNPPRNSAVYRSFGMSRGRRVQG